MCAIVDMGEIEYMVGCNTIIEQYTTYNCINPYSKEFKVLGSEKYSPEGTKFVKCVCMFERLFNMYLSSRNQKHVMVTIKH